MSRYRMQDGTVVDTEKASQSWDEASDWDGRNHISRATGTQFEHQRLYKSRKGRYYVEYWSNWQGSHAHAEWVSEQEAARWLILNEEELPDDLQDVGAEVTE